jgi:hypothetical protein
MAHPLNGTERLKLKDAQDNAHFQLIRIYMQRNTEELGHIIEVYMQNNKGGIFIVTK